jgi:hypothetical protein
MEDQQKKVVVNELKELKSLTYAIKELRAQLKVLTVQKKQKEEVIMDYLRDNNQPGVKYQDLIVLSKERTTFKRLKKKEKEENAIEVLESMGISDPKNALQTILNSMKGEETTVESLQIKEEKKDSYVNYS